jgi:hypothetical protein
MNKTKKNKKKSRLAAKKSRRKAARPGPALI